MSESGRDASKAKCMHEKLTLDRLSLSLSVVWQPRAVSSCPPGLLTLTAYQRNRVRVSVLIIAIASLRSVAKEGGREGE